MLSDVVFIRVDAHALINTHHLLFLHDIPTSCRNRRGWLTQSINTFYFYTMSIYCCVKPLFIWAIMQEIDVFTKNTSATHKTNHLSWLNCISTYFYFIFLDESFIILHIIAKTQAEILISSANFMMYEERVSEIACGRAGRWRIVQPLCHEISLRFQPAVDR